MNEFWKIAGDRHETFESFAQHVNAGKATTYREFGLDLIMGRREGPFLFDAYDERRWWNCHVNGGVFNLGHRNAGVLAAVQKGLEELDIGNHHFVSGLRARLAERLSASTGGQLSGVVFGVSGGEAIDLSIKVARWATKRQKIISACGGYHGHTGLALAAGDASYRDAFGDNLPGFVQVPFDDLEALGKELDDQTAAVILEPIPATLGMPICESGYLAAVQKLCRERGAKFIVDEVQTGLGRCGATWCYQLDDLEPDILVTGKGLSGGIYPITATLMTRELHRLFDSEPFIHISTFGGSELGCLAALAVLDQIEAEGFSERIQAQAATFAERLSDLPFALRQRGLMMGFKSPIDRGGQLASKMLYDAGVFATWANNDKSVLQFLPPLILNEEQVEELCTTVRRVFGE